MSASLVVAGYALRESFRRRVFLIVLVITVALGVLYVLGVRKAFDSAPRVNGPGTPLVDPPALIGGTLLGLAMFGALFLGTVLAVFLTLSAVRGDAERGLLQPLVVRPVGRPSLLLGRFLAAAGVCAVYVAVVYAAAVIAVGALGHWWPDSPVVPGLALMGAVLIVVAVSLLGSVFLTATANGIAVFMVFGGGLLGGLLGQVGEAVRSPTLRSVGHAVSWALPFEALYQAALAGITASATGITRVVVRLGPFGGAREAGFGLALWALAYLAAVGVVALYGFSRRDL